MNTERTRAWLTAFLTCLALVSLPATAQDSESVLSIETVRSRIAIIEDSAEVDDDRRAELIPLYRQAIANLEQARAHLEAADDFRESAERAPDEVASIRASIERQRDTDPTATLGITAETPSDEIDGILHEEIANRAEVAAVLASLESRLVAEARRPEEARSRIGDIRSQVAALLDRVDPGVPPDADPFRIEAERWAAESRLDALRAEIAMLDQELISHKARGDRLRAQRDEASWDLDRMDQRVAALRTAANASRRGEAGRAEVEARAMLAGGDAVDIAVRTLAQDNLVLVERMEAQVEELEKLAAREHEVRPQADQLAEAYRSTRRKLTLEGSRAPIGLAIREQRQGLPDAEDYAHQRRDLQRAITEVSLRRIESGEERKRLDDLEAYLEGRIERAGGEPPTPEARADLESLVDTRGWLLSRVVNSDSALERRLHSLDDMLRELEERTVAFDEFLSERLLWVRSRRPIDVAGLKQVPGELGGFFSPARWSEAMRSSYRSFSESPTLWLGLLLAVVLVGSRKRLRAMQDEYGRRIRRVRDDRMALTFGALATVVALSVPIPAMLAVLGRAMISAADFTQFSRGLGVGLLRASGLFLLLLIFLELSRAGGVAERHFGRDRDVLASDRRLLRWSLVVFVPVYFLMWSVMTIDPAAGGGTLGTICIVFLIVALGGLALGVARPRRRDDARVWPFVAVVLGVTVGLAALALAGFTHTVEELVRRMFLSALLLSVAWLMHALVRRWLLLTRRRLRFDAAVAAREARLAAAETDEPAHAEDDLETPEVDLVALDADSRRLLSAVIVFFGTLGLVGIWRDVIPALGVLDEVNLWSTVRLVDGVETQVPVTLIDLVIAVVIGVCGTIASQNLPSLINIILLKRGKTSAGTRYAVESLSRYGLVALTVVLVLGAVGVNASQMGWAAAALGVGIGFGVQEIVANFICGLILLFERPVRVGDVVTIGEASGTVTMIRIRATTLRDWDRKELVVPNKELITGRLLNWSLTDAITRVVVRVGVAYGSDVERSLSLLLEVARENDQVLDDPEPSVIFESFGDSSLDLVLRCFVRSLDQRMPTMTDLHRAIDTKYREAGIVIAFPQRDVHVHPANDGSGGPGPGEDGGSDPES